MRKRKTMKDRVGGENAGEEGVNENEERKKEKRKPRTDI